MYQVLMAIDDNVDRARAQAETVASLPHANEAVETVLLHVFTDNPSGASINQIGAVRRVEEHLEDRGISTELEERSGEPVTVILDVADEKDVDMICLAGRQRSPAGKALLGSVTQDVILSTHRPVLTCDAEGVVGITE